MRTEMITDRKVLHQYAPFILHAIDKVAKHNKEKFNSLAFFGFILDEVQTGRVGVCMQFVDDLPVLLCVIVLRPNDLGQVYAEIVLVYNLPTAKPKVGLEDYCIPWIKKNGASLVVTFTPEEDTQKENEVSSRRMRKYSFVKRATMFERIV
jgi:hypothetical protein